MPIFWGILGDMKSTWIERILLAILLVIAGGIVVHAPLTVWFGTTWPHYAIFIKAWKEVLMGLALVLLIVAAVQKRMAATLLRDRLMQLCLAYAALHFIMIAVFHHDLKAAGAGLLIDLRYVLYFVLIYGTLRLLPQYRTLFLKVFAGGAVVVIGFALLQIFVLPRDILTHLGYSSATIQPYLTIDKNTAFVRINSTLRGPNPLGAYAVIVLSMLLAIAVRYGRTMQPSRRWLLSIAAAATGLVLGVSYSRSSVIALVVAVIVTLGVTAAPKARRWLVATVLATTLALGAVLAVASSNPTVSNVVLHINPTGGSSVNSNAGHAESLVDGLKRIVREPLGGGVGTTGSASLDTKAPLIIENQYLFIAHEIGWLGLALYLWLFVEVMRRAWQRRQDTLALGVFASGCGLAVIGLMLPVWVDDTVSIVWWGLAAVAVAGVVKGKNHDKRKSH